MLRQEDNERLTRVGPGTPAGELFRRYWQPALLSSEVAAPDGAPVRVRLLGEDLLAFRDSDGRVGLVDAYCPHRLAPLFYGRNEECGIRCVYHGWKFNADGDCTDLPSEPVDSPMKAKVKIKAYPTSERGGVVWTYMGPVDEMPGPPNFEWTRAPETHRAVSKSHQACNYLQGLEGGLDTAHVSFLHNNKMGDKNNLFTRDSAPKIDVFETDYGYHYVSDRDLGEDGRFVRVYQYILPFQQMRPNITATGLTSNFVVPRYDGHIWVPIDDEHTFVYNWMVGYDQDCALDPEYVEKLETGYGRGKDDYEPGTFYLKANPSNNYFIDREDQKTKTFTGIKGINTQDLALQEEMGPIIDRSLEYLGTSDTAIIAMRKMLLDATHAVERGERPRGTDPEIHGAVRPHDGVVPKDMDWREAFAGELAAKF
ncbi:MAG: Rieske 2Fe-2S domain-containing protein [Rhodospirillales bacterium]|nr:Rieske 2Fe-2S domain-containing protein [Rhodospirillales bacterium]